MFSRTSRCLPSIHVFRTVKGFRNFYAATGSFVSLDSHGSPVTEEVKIFHGDDHEAYVVIPPEIGYALQAGSLLTNNMSRYQDPERHALTFFHETKSFAHGMQPFRDCLLENVSLTEGVGTEATSPSFPRLEIPRDLPRQNDGNQSPATLFLVGVSHTIALDGTLDGN